MAAVTAAEASAEAAIVAGGTVEAAIVEAATAVAAIERMGIAAPATGLVPDMSIAIGAADGITIIIEAIADIGIQAMCTLIRPTSIMGRRIIMTSPTIMTRLVAGCGGAPFEPVAGIGGSVIVGVSTGTNIDRFVLSG